MRFFNLGTGLCVLLLLGALGTGSAFAKSTLQLRSPYEEGRLLTPGNYVEAESAGGPTIESAAGTVVCGGGSFAGLYGTLLSNSAAKDLWSVTDGKSSFEGGSCTGSLPVGGELHQYWRGSAKLGTMSLAAKGQAQFKSPSTDHAALELASAETESSCSYSLKKLKGIATFGAGVPVEEKFSKQKLKLVAHSPVGCPKTVEMSVRFSLKTSTGALAEEHRAYNFIEGVVS